MNIKQYNPLVYLAVISVTILLVVALIYSPSLDTADKDEDSLPTFRSYYDLVNFVNSRIVNYLPIYTLEVRSAVPEAAYDEAKPSGYSQTNVQVRGIDESDIIKTDGEYIYFANNSIITIIKAFPPKSLEIASKINISGYYIEGLYISSGNNLLIAIGNRYGYIGIPEVRGISQSAPESKLIAPEKGREPLSSILVYDVSNPSSPKEVLNISFFDSIYQTRLYRSVLYVNSIQSAHRYNYESNSVEVRLPGIWINGMKQDISPSDIKYIPDLYDTSLAYNIIFALDLSTFDYNYEIVMSGYTGILYMSYSNIYIAQTVYPPIAFMRGEVLKTSNEVKTRIYKFSIDGLKIEPQAIGNVKGSISSQFQLDEYKGFLRVSTYSWIITTNRTLRYTNIFVLDSELNVIGSIEGLAESEMLYATRFMGDYAYLVTFRLIDPLFVINMEDPANPYVEGELKIPGFSTYLQPVTDTLLIGIGYETDNMTRVVGLKVSLFDVSDPSKPIEVDNIVFNTSNWIWSEALYNHKAILVMENGTVIGFSMTSYDYGPFSKNNVKYVLLKASNDGLNLIRSFDVYPNNSIYYDLGIVRGVYIDSYLYIVSYRSVVVYDLRSFSLVTMLPSKS